MEALTATTCRLSPTTHSHHLHRLQLSSILCPNSFKPFRAYNPKTISTITLSWPCLYLAKTRPPKRLCFEINAISGLENGKYETDADDLNKEVTIDVKLPRRSLLVEFTCNSCGERTQRLVNRLAYERGLIYVQCGGCLRHHKLVDNLGLVVEYDLRDETDSDKKGDEA